MTESLNSNGAAPADRAAPVGARPGRALVPAEAKPTEAKSLAVTSPSAAPAEAVEAANEAARAAPAPAPQAEPVEAPVKAEPETMPVEVEAKSIAEPEPETKAELEPVEPEPVEPPVAVEAALVDDVDEPAIETPPMDRPSPRQARAASILGGVLGASFDFGPQGSALGVRGWWLFQWPALTVGGQDLRPAMAGWVRERQPEVPRDDWPEAAPDWMCEVVSGPFGMNGSGRPAGDRALAQAGVRWLWIVDPVSGSLECLEASGGSWVRLGVFYSGETVIAPPFHQTAFPIDALWPE